MIMDSLLSIYYTYCPILMSMFSCFVFPLWKSVNYFFSYLFYLVQFYSSEHFQINFTVLLSTTNLWGSKLSIRFNSVLIYISLLLFDFTIFYFFNHSWFIKMTTKVQFFFLDFSWNPVQTFMKDMFLWLTLNILKSYLSKVFYVFLNLSHFLMKIKKFTYKLRFIWISE